MKIKSMDVELGAGCTMTVGIPNKEAKITVLSNGDIMVCNDCEEILYHLHDTGYGGFKLKEGRLL